MGNNRCQSAAERTEEDALVLGQLWVAPLSNGLINANTAALLWRPRHNHFTHSPGPTRDREDREDMEESPAAQDKRLDFIADYVLRTLKLKQDKWQKCVSSEDNRQVLQEFLDKAERRTLVVAVTAAGLLQTSASFAGGSKSKAVYFMKRSKAALSPESMKESLLCGDLSYAPLDQFSALVEEVSSRAEYVNYC